MSTGLILLSNGYLVGLNYTEKTSGRKPRGRFKFQAKDKEGFLKIYFVLLDFFTKYSHL